MLKILISIIGFSFLIYTIIGAIHYYKMKRMMMKTRTLPSHLGEMRNGRKLTLEEVEMISEMIKPWYVG